LNYKRWSIASLVLFVLCISLFYFLYDAEKERTIDELYARQLIHAKQAAKGLEDYIVSWVNQFNLLAQNESVIKLSPEGKKVIDSFYEKEKDKIGSILRVNDKGIITYAPASLKIEGKDIFYEKHIREIIEKHQAVVSDIFFAVQGYNAIAIHVPVFEGSKFIGTLGGIIKVYDAGKRFLEDIQIGESGYAWMISRDGTILYHPFNEYVGKSVYEIALEYPDMLETTKKMMAGESGMTNYYYNQTRNNNTEEVKKYAVYTPVKIFNTYWSIIIATAEEDVLNSLIKFRNKLTLILLAFFLTGTFFAYYGMKTWGILKESTAKKEAEEKLQILNAELENKVAMRTSQLERINRDLESFTYTVSHDLRAPLRAINGYTQALAEDYSEKLDIEAHRMIKRIKTATEKMDILIESILRLSRLNYQTLEISDVNMSVMLRSLAKEIQMLYPGVEYNVKVEDNIIIKGDYALINQLLDNLLRNAFKFSVKASSPSIEFFKTEKEGLALFCIKDNGAGFIGQNDEKLFTPFKRFHSDYEFEGIGIGLAIAKKIIDKHKGTIWAESQPGKGAAFYFTINV